MEWFNAELIQAIGIAIATVIGAVTAWQARQVKQLQARVASLETQMATERGKFRKAVRVIRGMQHYIDDLCAAMRRAGQDPPPNPVVIPTELEEEI
ncbi:hypothetical protein OIE68_15635 [Nocardia vinacea]|uniref:hypothetical protein n=1 Tax=Nocardia vinacea TaxID=96468 RepID=UPI002E148320|nr:hypothetical protein OIE68_15635 [Nocardia vinacea]